MLPFTTRLLAPAGIFALCLGLSVCIAPAIATTAAATQEPAAKQDQEARQEKMAERRAEREKKAQEMREKRNDPEFIKGNAWWNQKDNIDKLELTSAQRSNADKALLAYVAEREARQEQSRQTQQDFFTALESGAADIEKKKQAMVSAMSSSSLANADLRISVLSKLSQKQRTLISEDMPRVLRSNWADAKGGGRGGAMQQRRQRSPKK